MDGKKIGAYEFDPTAKSFVWTDRAITPTPESLAQSSGYPVRLESLAPRTADRIAARQTLAKEFGTIGAVKEETEKITAFMKTALTQSGVDPTTVTFEIIADGSRWGVIARDTKTGQPYMLRDKQLLILDISPYQQALSKSSDTILKSADAVRVKLPPTLPNVTIDAIAYNNWLVYVAYDQSGIPVAWLDARNDRWVGYPKNADLAKDGATESVWYMEKPKTYEDMMKNKLAWDPAVRSGQLSAIVKEMEKRYAGFYTGAVQTTDVSIGTFDRDIALQYYIGFLMVWMTSSATEPRSGFLLSGGMIAAPDGEQLPVFIFPIRPLTVKNMKAHWISGQEEPPLMLPVVLSKRGMDFAYAALGQDDQQRYASRINPAVLPGFFAKPTTSDVNIRLIGPFNTTQKPSFAPAWANHWALFEQLPPRLRGLCDKFFISQSMTHQEYQEFQTLLMTHPLPALQILSNS